MLCRDVMKVPVVHCRAHESVRDCARRMQTFNVGFLPVVDDTGSVIGVVTDRDLALRVLGRERPGRTPVRDVMSADVQVCEPGESLSVTEERMASTGKRRLVVVDGKGRGIGVIAMSDIARFDRDSRTGFLLTAVARKQAPRSTAGA